jgi:uncharacterized protein
MRMGPARRSGVWAKAPASLLLVLVLAPSFALGGETERLSEADEVAVEPSAVEPVQPFLWRVEGPAGPSWLFGTVHVGVVLAELPAVVVERLGASRVVVLEADVRGIDPFSMMEMVQLPEGMRLDALVRPDVWAALRGRLGFVFPEEQLVRLQPWFVESVLVTLEVPTLAPMDLALLQQAAARGQELRFLETWQEQLQLMGRVPLEQSAEDLTRWVDEPGEVVGELNRLLQAYRAGDQAGVESVVLDPESLVEHAALYEVTLFERNANWLPVLEPWVAEGGVFIAVGLGHLLGERGLVEMMRARGYTVEREGAE